MADMDIEITGSAAGAVAAVDSVIGSVDGLGEKMDALSVNFQKPLEHAGVHIFGLEMLKTVGLTGEARAILPLLNMAVNQTAAAFGIASGAVGLLVAGLGAMAAIYSAIKSRQDAHKESLDSVLKTEKETLDNTKELNEAYKTYSQQLGDMPPSILAAVTANETLYATMSKLYALDLSKQITDFSAAIGKITEEWDKQIIPLAATAASLNRFAAGSKEAKDATDSLNGVLAQEDAATASLTAKMTLAQEALERFIRTGDDRSLVQMMQDRNKEAQADKEFYDKAISDAIAGAENVYPALLKANAAYDEEMNKMRASMIEHAILIDKTLQESDKARNKMETNMGSLEKMTKTTFNHIDSAVSQGFAVMIVQSKSFSDAFAGVTQKIEEMFVQMIAEMVVKWVAFQAMTGGLMGGEGLMSSGAMNKFLGGTSFNVLGAADGFSGIVNQPTMFLAGEGGSAEEVNIGPVGGTGGGSGGGGNTFIFHAHGINDPEQFLQYAMQQIRGRGQIGATGPGLFGG